MMPEQNTFRRTTLNGISLELYIHSEKPLPLFVLITGRPDTLPFLESCHRVGCKAFNLLTIYNFGWDECLSPWPAPACVMSNDHFTGQADEFLGWIEQSALPWAKSQLPADPVWIGLAGYSMGGLFAIYTLMKGGPFACFASVSGSLWYPDFAKWVLSHNPEKKPDAVYFSLGNTETRTSNPYLQTTGDKTIAIEQHFQKMGIPTKFEWNPGNHFQNPNARIAKAIAWLLDQEEPRQN